MTAPEQPSSVPSPRRPRVATVVLASLVLVGVTLLAVAAWVASRPTSSGWFAYAPLSGTTFVPTGAYPLGTAALLAGAGALLVGGAIGFVLGRRSGPAAVKGSATTASGTSGPGGTAGSAGDEASAG
ncbi:hypothetical protein JN535_02735 [Cellulosimicrobium cellulans]|uniref:hypothetical protein n=1 Tax=Cellulosimicrobium cellulans TaxID=1710 RepID=UPI0019623193|nr:hypothetical protein [Cellulosimicrobium cellulans]MBN0039091.1 hypothetical protein [Cellulosimicrobium cellulans]